MKKFSILTNKSKDPDFTVSHEIERIIREHGGNVQMLGDPFDGIFPGQADGNRKNMLAEISWDTECVIVLGGDGTIIEAARAIGKKELPIVGINLGTLGFLSVVERSEIETAVKALLDGKFVIENRMLLKITLCKGSKKSRFMALNDVTVTRSGLSRIIRTDLFINDEFVTSYLGDGILVATPTGSTGYSLSAGGPIITPEAKLMCITPICPHTLQNRSIIIPGTDTVRIVIGEKKKSQETESYATIDGQAAIPLDSGDYIVVEKAKNVTKLVRFPKRTYFNVLHTKLSN